MQYCRALRRLLTVLCGLFVVTVGVAFAAAPAAPLAPWTNPVLDGDYPDPGGVYDSGQFWVATTASRAGIFPLLHSSDLRTWLPAGAAFPAPPSWAIGSFWAPALARAGNRILMYYGARDVIHRLCVGVATAPA